MSRRENTHQKLRDTFLTALDETHRTPDSQAE